jgi:PAS domain S-box-containing protein
MEITSTEIESLDIKGNDKLSLIIDAKLLTLTGPWHFEEEDGLSNVRVDLNKIQADFNYLINVMGCNNLMHPDDYNYCKKLLTELESGRSIDYHFKVITPNAEIKQIHGYGSLLSRESLQARIADWDETTSTIELHLKVFKYAEAVADMCSWTWNVETNAVHCSDNCYKLLGLKRQNTPPRLEILSRYIHADDLQKMKGAVQAALATLQPVSIEFRVIKNGNALRYFKAKGEIFTTRKNERYFIGSAQDITDQKIATQKIKETHDLLQSTFAASLNEIQVFNAVRNSNNEITGFQRLLHNRLPAANSDVDEVMKETETLEASLFEKYKAVVETGKSEIFEWENTEEAETRWYSISVVKLNDGILSTAQDITERKINEEKIKQHVHFIERVTKTTPHFINVYDFELKRHIFINKEIEGVIGLSSEEFKSKISIDLREVIHPDDFHKSILFADSLKKASDNEIVENTYRLKHVSGTWLWFHSRGMVFRRNEHGEVTQYIVVSQDITERKKSALEIEQQRERLQKILDAIPQMVWVYDVKKQNYFFNDRWYSYTGLTPEKCHQFDHLNSDVYHPSQKPEISQKWLQFIESGEPYSGEALIKNSAGAFRWHLDFSIPIKNSSSEVEFWVGTFTDVHEQFLAEKRLKENSELLEAIFNSSINAIQVLDAVHDEQTGELIDFSWKYYNSVAQKIWRAKNLIGKRLTKEYPIVCKNGMFDKMKSVIETAKSQQFELRYSHARDSFRWFDISIVKLEDGVVLTFHDITEKKNAQQEMQKLNDVLRQRNQDLKSLNDELSTFAFIASHDLREPLRKIQVFSQALIEIENKNLTDRGKEYFNRMIAAVDRMNNLIDSILAFSRTSASNKQNESLNLNEILNTVLHEFQDEIAEKGVLLECGQLPVFKGSALQFTQLLQNLISNALKFRRNDVVPQIKIASNFLYGHEINDPYAIRDKQYLKLEIADNGIGFDQKYAGKIFQMFQRLHTQSEFPGTGMGLAICKKIVENHDGFMVAKSTPGEGAAFTCYFPLERIVA